MLRPRVVRIASLLLGLVLLGAPRAARADDTQNASAEEEALRRAKTDASVLLRKMGETKDPKHFKEIVDQLDALDVRAQVLAYVDGLKNHHASVRQFCIRRLKEWNVVRSVPHLVLAATTDSDEAVRLDAQAAARDLDPDYARRWYEHVAVQDQSHRTAAIDGIASLGTRAAAALPLLSGMMDVTRDMTVDGMQVAGIDVNATNARELAFRSVNVNLGSNNKAATAVPIELPALSLDQVRTTVNVPLASYTPWKDSARSAARSVLGFDLGSDSDAWREWWKAHKQEVFEGTWKAPTYTGPDPVEQSLSLYANREKEPSAWARSKADLLEGGKPTLRRLLALAQDSNRAAKAFAVLRAVTGELIPDDATAWKAHIDALK